MFRLWRGWGKKGKITPDLPWFGLWGLRPLSFFLLIIGPPLPIEWGGSYIGYMGNRERDIQIIGLNLNGLGLKKYNGLDFWALI